MHFQNSAGRRRKFNPKIHFRSHSVFSSKINSLSLSFGVLVGMHFLIGNAWGACTKTPTVCSSTQLLCIGSPTPACKENEYEFSCHELTLTDGSVTPANCGAVSRSDPPTSITNDNKKNIDALKGTAPQKMTLNIDTNSRPPESASLKSEVASKDVYVDAVGKTFYRGKGCSQRPIGQDCYKMVGIKGDGTRTDDFATLQKAIYVSQGPEKDNIDWGDTAAPAGRVASGTDASGHYTETDNGDGTKTRTYDSGLSVKFDSSGNPETGADGKPVVTGRVKENGSGDKYSAKAYLKGANDQCKYSTKIDGNFSCDSTYNTVEAAKVTNAAGQMIGATAVQAIGGAKLQEAQQSGKMSDVMNATADSTELAAKVQMANGAINSVMAMAQYAQARGHEKNAKTINDQVGDSAVQANAGTVTGNALQNKVIGKFELNEGYQAERGQRSGNTTTDATSAAVALAKDKEQAKWTQGKLQGIADNASDEQSQAKKAANQGAMMSFISGAKQLIEGGFNFAAAGKMRSAADKMGKAEDKINGQENNKFDIAPVNADKLDARTNSGTIVGPGAVAETAAGTSEDVAKEEDKGDLGRSFSPDKRDDAPVGAPLGAPKFVASGNTGGGGGGGSGGGLGGGAGGGSGSGEEAAADAGGRALDMKGNDRYATAGGGYAAPAGARAPAGNDKGPDFGGMLAQFLPKDKDDAANKNGILDFGNNNGGAMGGSANSPVSLLDKNVNIFKRIHDTYQDKNKHGIVGEQ